MLQAFMIFCFAVSALCPYVAGETGCPDEERILPCTCTRYPQPRLTCKNLYRSDAVSRVFDASKRYSYQEVRIEDSAMLFIPVEIFEKAAIASLHLVNSTFSMLTDEPVREIPHLSSIQLENTKILRAFTSQNFTLFTSLREIVVKSSPVRMVPSKYGKLLPKSLKHFTLYETGTKKIGSGAFVELPNIDKIVVESNKLTQLDRGIFPVPFNARILSFDSNRITSIPEDLFSDMPNLQFLSLKNNQISTIHEATFSGRESNIPYLKLDGNPLECDCQLLWLIKDKPEFLSGNCTSPVELKGRTLQDLSPSELSC